mmetsp:Transcript_25027/g.39319  ORF Transcript_25027/g.39319 Transcript_25027/m.39319 type:complete len:510 (+) Transcript_25027:77-1606(+)
MIDDYNSILREAQLINNDLGRHSVKCNFSTRLSGRFYQNCSLERHTMRRSRLSEMQSKRRRLERELMLEKRRVKLLGARLDEMENAREFALDMIFAIQRGVIEFQALVRRRQAMELLESMKYRVRMREMIALFCQSRYRGWRGRLRAASTREYLRQQLMNKCATVIQTFIRCHIQRKVYISMLLERQILRDKSAVSIQSAFRGHRLQRLYREEMRRRQEAALNVQRAFRGMKGRRVADRLREELARLRVEAEEKPKRIPLHMRRYSTYGASANESQSQHRRNSILSRRRGSIDLTKSSPSAFYSANSSIDTRVDADENDSLATTITSLTNHTEVSRKSSRLAVRGNNRKKLSLQSPPPGRRSQAAAASSQSPSMKRRSTYSEGRIQSVPRIPNREKRKSLRSYAAGDITKSTSKASHSGRLSSSPPIKELNAPINITDEACSIAEEVKVLAATSTPTERAPLTIPEVAAVFMKDVIAESIIAYNINSALMNIDDVMIREEDEDLAFLFS